jgi:hypothetical protein
LLSKITADAYGRFSIKVNQNTLDSSKDELFGEIEITKSSIFTDTLTNTIVKKFDPIPLALNGTAYSNSGQPLANATVGIYPSFSNKPYYTTTTDIAIPTNSIPLMPYSIKYSQGGNSVSVSTTKFLSDNKDYLVTNQVNPFSSSTIATNTPTGSASNGNIQQGVSGVPFNNNSLEKSITASNGVTATNNMKILGLVFVIIILFILAVVLLIYLYRKNSLNK